MTGETVDRCLSVFVTVHTPAHCQRCNLFGSVHAANLAVTKLASDTGTHMAFVREPNVIGQIVDTDPGNRFFDLHVVQNFLYLGAVGFDKPVTPRAARYRRQTSDGTTPCKRVA